MIRLLDMDRLSRFLPLNGFQEDPVERDVAADADRLRSVSASRCDSASDVEPDAVRRDDDGADERADEPESPCRFVWPSDVR